MDGNMDLINAISDKPTRGMAKAALVRAKRVGKMPENLIEALNAEPIASASATPSREESEETLIARLVEAGVQGNMDETNALDNKVLRGKIKAAIVKAKRAAK